MARDKKAVDGLTFVLDGPNGVELVAGVDAVAVRAALAPFAARIPVRVGYARDPLRRFLLTRSLDVPRDTSGARLPISMVTLGIVLLISARTDSYALAGGISAAFVVASGVR